MSHIKVARLCSRKSLGFREANGKYRLDVNGQGKKWANYWLGKMLLVKWDWQWICLGFKEVAVVEGCRRDCTTTLSHTVVSCRGGGGRQLSCRDTTQLPFISLPMGLHKNQEQMSVIGLLYCFFWLGSRDPSWLCVAAGRCRHVKFTAFCLIHRECTHSSQPSREQQLWGLLLFYVSFFATDALPGWLGGGETPSVSVSAPLMDSAGDAGSCFEEQGMNNKFQQTW